MADFSEVILLENLLSQSNSAKSLGMAIQSIHG